MSVMQVFDTAGHVISPPVFEIDQISPQLSQIGVRLEQWQAEQDLPADAEQEGILQAYQDYIARLNQEYGFEFVDVSALWPDHPKKQELRQQFFSEHTHTDDEVRFFVEGSGLFYFHVGDKVYLVLCEKGDLISVPSRTTHWFDMGANPDFKLIRFFPTHDGWVAENTGSEIANLLPDMDDFVASLA